MHEDLFDANALLSGIVVTGAVGLCLALTTTPVAFPVLVVLAFASGRMGGRDAGLASMATGALMFGYVITEPHFAWELSSNHEVILLVSLFICSLVAAELGVHLRRRSGPIR